MPTYEYECEKCHFVFEEFQNISAEPLKKCRNEGCEGTVKRLFSPGAGFLFKGSGFYITDYRSDSYKKRMSSDAPSAGSTSSSSTDTATKTAAPSSPATPAAST